MDREVALEALSTLCNANVTSVGSQGAGQPVQQLLLRHFIPAVLAADDTCDVSRSNFVRLQSFLQSGVWLAGQKNHVDIGSLTGPHRVINENEFFAPQFDYDFTYRRDTQTYYRGGEVYERPYGWQRFALKVLDKYNDNTWLGNSYRSTQSVPGEWPVSYHGTSKSGAEGIIKGCYEPGPGEVYGRGIYSTPHMAEAIHYAKTFTSQKTGKMYRVVLQNRVNPNYRFKYNNDKYWLIPIPKGTSAAEEQRIVENTIRPYGLLLQDVNGICTIL